MGVLVTKWWNKHYRCWVLCVSCWICDFKADESWRKAWVRDGSYSSYCLWRRIHYEHTELIRAED